MKKTILKIQHLQKTYQHQNHPSLDDISFELSENEKVGIVGANGSGKTTLFKLILNLLIPDRGKIEFANGKNKDNQRCLIGYVPEHQQGLENFTPNELLFYAGRMSGMTKEKINQRSTELLKWTKLEKNKSELLGSFSKGMIQRLQLAIALLNEPEILLLDEPMSGLDPSGQEDLRSLLKELEEYTLLYASHNLSDIDLLCERVIFLQQGRLLQDLKLSEVEEEIYSVEADPLIEEVLQSLQNIKIRQKNIREGRMNMEFSTSIQSFQDLLDCCKKRKITIYRFRSRSILEDLYEKYVKQEI
jgi:ABC-2 type transport system ATP-binding protein